MRSGNLDRRIVIEKNAASQNSFGEPEESWSTFATVWANVRPVRGNEQFASDQRRAERQSIFRIRYLSGLTEKMRISHDSAYYDIEGIIEIGRREGMEITATAVNP